MLYCTGDNLSWMIKFNIFARTQPKNQHSWGKKQHKHACHACHFSISVLCILLPVVLQQSCILGHYLKNCFSLIHCICSFFPFSIVHCTIRVSWLTGGDRCLCRLLFIIIGAFMFFCDIALSSKISLVQYMVSNNTLLLNFQICVGLNQIF